MPTSLIIVDDFLENADELRRAALRLTYPPQEGAFPGRNSLERIEIGGLARKVSDLVREPLKVDLAAAVACEMPHLAGGRRGPRQSAHRSWRALVGHPVPQSARRLRTAVRSFSGIAVPVPIMRPSMRRSSPRLGYSSDQEMHREIIEKDSSDDAKWELTMRVPMRFNRLILLRPWLWHTAGPAFGDSMENGRLVYLMFFESGSS